MTSTSNPFTLGDIKTMHRLDHSLVDLLKGKRDFECPDIDIRVRSTSDGYKPNELERQFTKKAQHYALINFFKYTAVGAFAGYALASRRPGAMLVSVSVGSVVGSTFGVTVATVGIMRRQLRLENSPVGLESRYQLWKMNPQHQWLEKHQDDVQRWNRMTYYRGTGANDASIDHNHKMEIENHIEEHLLNEYEDTQRMDQTNIYNDNDTESVEEMQTQKRQRFYDNRQRLGHTEGHDAFYDYSHEHNTQRTSNINTNHDNDTFEPNFHSQTDMNTFIDHGTDDGIKWG